MHEATENIEQLFKMMKTGVLQEEKIETTSEQPVLQRITKRPAEVNIEDLETRIILKKKAALEGDVGREKTQEDKSMTMPKAATMTDKENEESDSKRVRWQVHTGARASGTSRNRPRVVLQLNFAQFSPPLLRSITISIARPALSATQQLPRATSLSSDLPMGLLRTP